MEHRRKDAGRFLDEIKELTATWGAKRFAVADNIMPLSFLRDLLPALTQWKGRPNLFYEVKANLREEQLHAMLNAGVDAIQPGIESFSTHVLRLMRKGVSGPQNLVLLRTCRSLGIKVGWNYLYGFPGEELEDYENVLPLIPKIEHLDPPTGCNGLLIDRFSPYFNTPEQFGIENLAPRRNYYGLYPHAAPVSEIAYHFSGQYSTPLLACEASLSKLRAAVALWREQWTPQRRPVLVAVDAATGGVAITDTRRIARSRQTVISPAMDAALRHFERPKAADRIAGVTAEQVEYLLDRHFIVEHEGQLLSVVTRLHTALALSKIRPQPAAA
jgi:ribosomal peptide maturation radical SAM protein 1